MSSPKVGAYFTTPCSLTGPVRAGFRKWACPLPWGLVKAACSNSVHGRWSRPTAHTIVVGLMAPDRGIGSVAGALPLLRRERRARLGEPVVRGDGSERVER
jgi:hypothetical protein